MHNQLALCAILKWSLPFTDIRAPRGVLLAIGLVLILAVLALPVVLFLAARRERRRARREKRRPRRWLSVAAWGTLSALGLVLLDGFFIEPSLLTTTRVTFPIRQVPAGATLRIVHLSDLHIIHWRPLYARLARRVAEERPDLILLTGDQLQVALGQPAAAQRLFNQLAAVAPVVMILGNRDAVPPLLSPRWRLLRDQAVNLTLHGVPLRVLGWEQLYRRDWRPPRLGIDPRRVNIVLEHSPDWFDTAAAQGANLALAGHTHGGQVRLPWWGAVLTSSIYGKRFEYGTYHLHAMHAFVTRGLAQNPWPSPPIRFLCPPEMVVITLVHGE